MLGWGVLSGTGKTILNEEDVNCSKTVLTSAVLGIGDQCDTIKSSGSG